MNILLFKKENRELFFNPNLKNSNPKTFTEETAQYLYVVVEGKRISLYDYLYNNYVDITCPFAIQCLQWLTCLEYMRDVHRTVISNVLDTSFLKVGKLSPFTGIKNNSVTLKLSILNNL